LAHRLDLTELEGRIDCFGEFDRSDQVCLSHCALNFECAAAREHYRSLVYHDDSLEELGCDHSA